MMTESEGGKPNDDMMTGGSANSSKKNFGAQSAPKFFHFLSGKVVIFFIFPSENDAIFGKTSKSMLMKPCLEHQLRLNHRWARGSRG